MKTTITQSDFVSAFKRSADRKDCFSYAGLCALFDHYEQLEQDTGEEIELDAVAICCDWTEYASALEAAQAYGFEGDEEDRPFYFLTNKTTVLMLDGGSIVVLNF